MAHPSSKSPFNDMSDEQYARSLESKKPVVNILHDAEGTDLELMRQTSNVISPIVVKMMDDIEKHTTKKTAIVCVIMDEDTMGLMSNLGDDQNKAIELLEAFIKSIKS